MPRKQSVGAVAPSVKLAPRAIKVLKVAVGVENQVGYKSLAPSVRKSAIAELSACLQEGYKYAHVSHNYGIVEVLSVCETDYGVHTHSIGNVLSYLDQELPRGYSRAV